MYTLCRPPPLVPNMPSDSHLSQQSLGRTEPPSAVQPHTTMPNSGSKGEAAAFIAVDSI